MEVIIFHYLKGNLAETMNLAQLEDINIRNVINGLLDMGLLEKIGRTYMLTPRVYKVLTRISPKPTILP